MRVARVLFIPLIVLCTLACAGCQLLSGAEKRELRDRAAGVVVGAATTLATGNPMPMLQSAGQLAGFALTIVGAAITGASYTKRKLTQWNGSDRRRRTPASPASTAPAPPPSPIPLPMGVVQALEKTT